MARMPGAIWKPLAANWASQPRMRAHDIFCLHTMVGSLVGTDGYFKVGNGAGYGGTESHFGVGPDGTIYQWQDTDFQADANGNGNHHIISSENADTGAPFPAWGGSNVPAFTPQQVEANARIAAWLNQVHGIPLDLIPDAKPGRRGIGWHRQGVPGYMVAGAEQWSSSPGKVCPGDRRIAQAPAVSARAKQIRSGSPTTTVQEDDMPLTDDDIRRIWQYGIAARDGKAPAEFVVREIQQKVFDIPGGVANVPVPEEFKKDAKGNPIMTPAWVYWRAAASLSEQAARNAAGIAQALESNSPEAVAAAVAAAMPAAQAAEVASRLTVAVKQD